MIFFKCLLNKRPETTDLTKYLEADAKFAIDSILTSDRKKTVAQQVLPHRFHDKQVKSLRMLLLISELNYTSTFKTSDIYTATFYFNLPGRPRITSRPYKAISSNNANP